ncbi:MAG: 1-acyl-sn-glycerol-3-phosphate acyltransferase [Bacteroidales bacterium]|nr:1-acyl-sn-glycerol-3-phosphate acyltransferase [Bacteroidales bacterium]
MDIIKSIVIWFIGIGFFLVFFPLTFIVWLLTLPFDSDRTITHWMLIYQVMIISYLVPVWRLRIEGRRKAVAGTTYVIISNHQSILDILLINCLRYRFKWISKIENSKVPVLGWYIKMAAYLTVDRGNKESKEKMMEEAFKCLKKGISIMIFPEGTRSADSQISFFKRGAFQLAISAGKPILPVLIDGTGGVLPKHGLIFGGFHKIIIRVLDPVMPDSFGTDDCDELAMKFQKMMMQELTELRKSTTIR